MTVILALLSSLVVSGSPSTDTLAVTVDSHRHQITIVAGPFRVPPMVGTMDAMDHGAAHNSPLEFFKWPNNGWFRGFRIDLIDRQGQPIPHRILHHLIVVNFDRRELIYPMFERLVGAGAETGEVLVPGTVGVPMTAGMLLGMYAGWHNETGSAIDDVFLKLTLRYTPENQVPAPVSTLPLLLDVAMQVGDRNSYDLPPGRLETSHEFELPLGGRLLGVGGHLHDYGVSVRLEEVATGKVLFTLPAFRGTDGRVSGVARRLFGITGRGLLLRAGRRYRVVGVYENPTGHTLVRGAMANMIGLFAPDDATKWPGVDFDDPLIQRDLASLKLPPRFRPR